MKNLKIRNKMIVGFGIAIILSVVLAIFAYVALSSVRNSYQNKLDYTEARVQTILEIATDVMDLRRITTAIRADNGMTERMQGHSTASAAVFADINSRLDDYFRLVENDSALTPEQTGQLLGYARSLRSTALLYRQNLVEPNIAFGMAGDLEGLSANSTAQAPLIAEIQSTIATMRENEYNTSKLLIAQTAATTTRYLVIFICLAVAIVVISIVFALLIAKSISKPMIELDSWLKETSHGNITWTPEELMILHKYSAQKDEIGSMMASYAKLVEYMNTVSNALASVSSGDLTVDAKPSSEQDTLSLSLQKMLADLNHMFTGINSSAHQVTDGSKQIADGAQMLAQGSTEQAASVQQLSASVSQIAKTTKENAEMAEHAAALARTIMSNAEKGSSQMDDMMNAVKDINQASSSISKVIKVIDDIAFQTNILALNAAVEAARAGQHGKGFAVVAEEVRNLAAKSAEAAKDTGGLIANSMEKAELGARIAEETALSLNEIVDGIKESTQIINDIARSSEEQALGINQINTGIDQVAQVVSQNSATAQESAAASEEMSEQANTLGGLMAQFRLKDAVPTFGSLSGKY